MRLDQTLRNELNKIKRFWDRITGRRQLGIDEFGNRMMDLADAKHESIKIGKARLEYILSQTTFKVIFKYCFT